MAVSAADAPSRRPRPLPLLLLLCFAARASSIHVAGFKDFEANCAACDVIAHAAQAQLKENPKKLASDPIARVEALEELCARVQFAYPKIHNTKVKVYEKKLDKKVLAFTRIEPEKHKDKNESKVERYEQAKHATEMPETIVRGKEKNVELVDHCNKVMEEHDEAMDDLWKAGDASKLRAGFCVSAVKACTKGQLEEIDNARRPPEPEMPVGMRPEDWPKYKNKMYDKKGRMKMAGSKPLGGSPFSGSEKGEL
jgi:hypothetical protein